MTKDEIRDKEKIEILVSQLSPCNQAYILNTIDALLYSQNADQAAEKADEKEIRQNSRKRGGR